MESKHTKVILIGATGETGSEILTGLVDHGGFDIIIFTRDSSRSSSAVAALRDRGFRIISAPPNASVNDLALLLEGIDVVISAVAPTAILSQKDWVSAANLAGVKRFMPCGFSTVCPRGIMRLRDEKEHIHDHILRLRQPYTIIDVGYWYDVSHFLLPSGKLDSISLIPNKQIYGDGKAPNLLIDKSDIGKFVARIAADPRTLNKKVIAYGDQLSQLQIRDIMERLSGETLDLQWISERETINAAEEAVAAVQHSSQNDLATLMPIFSTQYRVSKYIRADNTLENAEYLGYLDARELYPDLKPKPFE